MFGWAVARGSKTTQASGVHPAGAFLACATRGSGPVLVVQQGNFRGQAPSSERKDKQKRGMGANYKVWVQEGDYSVCAFCRAFGRRWGCREVFLRHTV